MNKNFAFTIIIMSFLITHTSTAPQKSTKKFTLISPAFAHNGMIPSKYTGDGQNISPALQWANPPHGTKSFALIVDDPDAEGKPWVHWMLFNIPASLTKLAEGIQKSDFMSGATNFYYTKNGIFQYGGPFPPEGTHHYHFILYALDTKLNLSQDIEREDLENAIRGHIIGQATLIGLYKRNN